MLMLTVFQWIGALICLVYIMFAYVVIVAVLKDE